MPSSHWRGDASHAYFWDRCLLFQARSLVVDRRAKPYRRMAATVLVACRGSMVLELGDEPPRTYEGVLVAPAVARRFIEANDCNVTIMDAGITSAAYRTVAPMLERSQIQPLGEEQVAAVRALIEPAFVQEMTCPEAVALFDRVMAAVAGTAEAPPDFDPRIRRVLDIIEEKPLGELPVSELAAAVQLSESRLRALFQKNLGCTIPQIRRWMTVWKAASLYREGLSFTDIAHAVGFYDLAHADHVLGDTFGISPTDMTDASKLVLHKCEGETVG